MPSRDHESLLHLFRQCPTLAVTLLRELQLELPRYQAVELASVDFNQAAPVEYRADLSLVLRRGSRAVFAIVLEVQLSKDRVKPFSWPAYVTTMRARYRCPACVLVVAGSEEVARWAARGVPLGPGSYFQPWVIGPAGVPRVTSLEVAQCSPELAVLSAVAHAQGPDAPGIAAVALAAALRLTEDESKLYSDWILNALGPAARRALEEAMAIDFEPRSELVRQWLAEGKATGLAEGEAKGLAEGEAKGLAEAVIAVFDARGLACSVAERQHIRHCRELSLLRRWLQIAVTCSSASELFR